MFDVIAEGDYDAETDVLRSGAVTCEISSAIPGAIRVRADKLRVGDRLFDAFAGTHEITERRRRGSSPWIKTVREDGWEDRFHADDLITIIRSTQED